MGYDSGIDTMVGVTVYADQVPEPGKVQLEGETVSWDKASGADSFGWKIEAIADSLELESASNQVRPEVTNKWMVGVRMEGTRPTKKAIREATALVESKLVALNRVFNQLGIEFTKKDIVLDDLTWISV